MAMLEWLRSYQRDWLRPDLLAGLITAAVARYQAMAVPAAANRLRTDD